MFRYSRAQVGSKSTAINVWKSVFYKMMMRHSTLLENKWQLLFVNITLREKWATLGEENLAPGPVLLLQWPSFPSEFCSRTLLFSNFLNI